MTMTDTERVALLSSLGLDAEAPNLAAKVDTDKPAKVKKAKKRKVEVTVTKPDRVDDIVFDADLLADFALDATDIKQASDLLFQTYKFPRGDERNKLLHRTITEFIARVKRDRNPAPRDGHIKHKVKAGKGQRDLAQMLADNDIDADDLAVMLNALAAHKASKS